MSATLTGLSSGQDFRLCVGVGGGAGGTSLIGNSGYDGGGASGIAAGVDFSVPLLVAGGGGGGVPDWTGRFHPTTGGSAGYPSGSEGEDFFFTGGGGGGEQFSEGGGGAGYNGGSNGQAGGLTSAAGLGTGGSGGSDTTGGSGGGGGGAGWTGGGGGGGFDGGASAGAGGGGSDFCSSHARVSDCQVSSGAGSTTSSAKVVIKYGAPTTVSVRETSGDPWTGTETTGSSAKATATITGQPGIEPTGTVTYRLYDGGSCSGAAVSTEAVTFAGGGSVPISSASSALAGGSHSYKASYSGDSNYGPYDSACQSFDVAKATPSLTTTVYDGISNTPWDGTETPGAKAYDTATLGSLVTGYTPTGTVTYTLFTTASDCTGASDNETVTVAGDGSVPNSTTRTSFPAGSYSYRATYSGDSNYAPATGACEPFEVATFASPSISSADHATFTVGGAGSFTITTIAGRPSGTVIFKAGALPSNVSFQDNHNGTATIAGTPAAGTAGVYPLTITATNGSSTDATQSFSLTVNDPPAQTPVDTPVETPVDDPAETVPAPQVPETTIGHHPKNRKRAHTHFRFRSSIPGSSFECTLDGGAPEACSSPQDYRHLEPGRHVFKVAATAPNGQTDPTPAKARFRVVSPAG